MKVANRSSHVIARLFPEDKKNNLVIHMCKTCFFRFHIISAHRWGYPQLLLHLLDCRAGGHGFDSQDCTNTQGLKMTEK